MILRTAKNYNSGRLPHIASPLKSFYSWLSLVMQDYVRVVKFLRNEFVFSKNSRKYLELKIYRLVKSSKCHWDIFFHSWSPVISTVYPSCLSCDFLNANSAVPAKPIRHIRNKAIIREGLEPIKGWELQLTEAKRERIVHTAIVWKLYIFSVPIMLKKTRCIIHNFHFKYLSQQLFQNQQSVITLRDI